MPSQKALFEAQQTLEAFCEKIVLPNMTLRKFEEEMFEDDALEYVRRDLESASAFIPRVSSFKPPYFVPDIISRYLCSDSETRRQAASDFTKALMEQFEPQVTAIVTRYIGAYLTVSSLSFPQRASPYFILQQYASDPQGQWRSKDTAIFLLTSIASRGSTVQVRF